MSKPPANADPEKYILGSAAYSSEQTWVYYFDENEFRPLRAAGLGQQSQKAGHENRADEEGVEQDTEGQGEAELVH